MDHPGDTDIGVWKVTYRSPRGHRYRSEEDAEAGVEQSPDEIRVVLRGDSPSS